MTLPQLPVIPYWLINWATKQLAAWLLELMAQKAAQLPDVYATRMAANPRVYAEVARRLKEHGFLA